MKPHEAYDWLVGHSKETAYLDSMRSLLSWDQRTQIPEKGHRHRAAQLATMAGLVHNRMTDPRIGEMLARVEDSELVADALSVEAVNVREWRRSYDRAIKVPERLAVALAKVSAEGESAWEKARPRNDWPAFEPYLNRIVALTREKAEAIGYANEPYDALLDEYETGETAKRLERLFDRLRKSLMTLLERIRESSVTPRTSVLRRHYPRQAQEFFSRMVLDKIGYDLEGGRLDPSAHPFTVGIGPGDVRITARYNERFFSEGFFSIMHEAGHALYDQGLSVDHWGTPMGEAASLGIHESQSRMWENLVCRSLHFWQCFFPHLCERFRALKDVSLESFYLAVNEVRPSLIRVEADEVTYNLHIMLRFELEVALMRGALPVDELPGAWNEKMHAYLGLKPPDNAQGVMQDVHWSGALIGYFPTYTLGNLYAAQFFAQAEQTLGNLEDRFAREDFRPLLGWLREKIHSQGSRYRPRDLIHAVTGEDLNPENLTRYLEDKYGNLYG